LTKRSQRSCGKSQKRPRTTRTPGVHVERDQTAPRCTQCASATRKKTNSKSSQSPSIFHLQHLFDPGSSNALTSSNHHGERSGVASNSAASWPCNEISIESRLGDLNPGPTHYEKTTHPTLRVSMRKRGARESRRRLRRSTLCYGLC